MISFNCPYCAHPFNVDEILSGKTITCPQCKTGIPVPGEAPPQPGAPATAPMATPQSTSEDRRLAGQALATKKAHTNSIISLVLGGLSLVCGCFSMPFSLLFGILALSKSGVDPEQVGGIRVKSIAGMAMSFFFTLIWSAIVIMAGAAQQEKRARMDEELAIAEAAYREKEYEKAKAIYEIYAEEGYNEKVKAKSNLHLGHIAFEEGRMDQAKSYFRTAVDLDSSIVLKNGNKEAKRIFRDIRIEILVKNGEIFFPVSVEGKLNRKVRFSLWRIKGNSIKCNVNYPGKWSDMQIGMVVYGENNQVLGNFNFTHSKEDDLKPVGFLEITWKREWNQILKLVVYVHKK